MRRRPMPLEVSEEQIERALGDVLPDTAAGWRALREKDRTRYLGDIRRYGGEPPELTCVLAQGTNRQQWLAVPWLVRLDYCRNINRARWARKRRKLARAALEAARSDPAAKLRQTQHEPQAPITLDQVRYRSGPRRERLAIPWEDTGSLLVEPGRVTFRSEKQTVVLERPRVVDVGPAGVDRMNLWVTVEDTAGRRALFGDAGLWRWRSRYDEIFDALSRA